MSNVALWRLDLLKENAEELEALWNQRLRAERSLALGVNALDRMDRRIAAHADALAQAGAQAAPFVEGLLAGGNPAATAAAALVIGWSDAPAMVPRLLEAFFAASSKQRLAMVAALELRAARGLLDALARSSWSDPEARAGAIAICAAHGDPRTGAMQPEALLAAPSPTARVFAWRAVRYLGSGIRVEATRYDQGRADPDGAVQRAALEAAVVAREPGLVDELRRLAATPDVTRMEAHLLFAVLAGASDVPRVLSLAGAPALGRERYRILGACGRAPAVEALLAAMRAADRVEAALAGVAFHRIVGVNVAADERVPLVASGTEPDDFTDLVHVCDLSRAEQSWNQLRAKMGSARWVHGVDAETSSPESLPGVVDLEARWAAELRAAFTSRERRLRLRHERLGR